MASTCRWRSWESTFEWDAGATVPADIRTRIEAFLAADRDEIDQVPSAPSPAS